MSLDFISYSFDAEEWAFDGKNIDFGELAYPDFLHEFTYGDLALTDEHDHEKCLHLSEVELGFLAARLAYHVPRLQAGEAEKAFIASVHQHFELLLRKDGAFCWIAFADEPEKEIKISFIVLETQLASFRQKLWADMEKYYPYLDKMAGFEDMKRTFAA